MEPDEPSAEAQAKVLPQSPTAVFSSADRIKQLNEIDKDISTILLSAAQAIKAITTSNDNTGNLITHQDQFKKAVANYFRLLSSVDVRIGRQIQALEEADIIIKEPPPKDTDAVPTTITGGKAKDQYQASAASGMGNLDVGWLNGRGDAVEREMEAELWAKARELADRLKTKDSLEESVHETKEDNAMETDPDPDAS